MRLRPATSDDLALLRHWDEQAHVIESDPNDDWQWESELGRNPAWREQLIAELSGRPIGFVQIIDPAAEDSHYWGDCPNDLCAVDIWIGEAADLGRGYGTRIMQLVLARCFADPRVAAVILDPLASNHRARRFYERLGFRFVELRQLGQDRCAVYRLDRDQWRPVAGIDIVADRSEPARDGELEALLERAYVDAGYTDRELAASLFTATAVRQRGELLLARDRSSRAVVGMVILVSPTSPARRLAGPEEAELHLLAVAPDRRHAGIGAALVDAVIGAAGAGSHRRLLLWTQPAMAAAQRLYRRCGFVRAPARDMTRDGRAFLVYQLDLAPRPRANQSPRGG